MPLLENPTAPVAEFCSLRQAFQWISEDILPRLYKFEDAFHINRHLNNHDIQENSSAVAQLYLKLVDGTLYLYGKKGVGEPTIEQSDFSDGGDFYLKDFPEWGEEEQVPIEDIGTAGRDGLDIRANRLFQIIGSPSDPYLPTAWAYTALRIPTAVLFRTFPSHDGIELPYMETLWNATRMETTRQAASMETLPILKAAAAKAVAYNAHSLPLSLNEAVCLLATEDPYYIPSGLSEEQAALGVQATKLVRWLEGGYLTARGKFSNSGQSGDFDQWEWYGHAMERTAIPADWWQDQGVNLLQSSLTTSQGEYIEIRLEEADVRSLAALLKKRSANTISAPADSEASEDIEDDTANPARKQGRGKRPDWPIMAALTAIICEREASSGEIASDKGVHDRLKLILEAAGYSCPGNSQTPSRSLFTAQALGDVKRAIELYEEGCLKSPPRST